MLQAKQRLDPGWGIPAIPACYDGQDQPREQRVTQMNDRAALPAGDFLHVIPPNARRAS